MVIIFLTIISMAFILALMVFIHSFRWVRVVFLRNYRLFLRSRYYGLTIDIIYEGGKTLLATALIGGLFVPDDKVTLNILLKLFVFGIITYVFGYLKKEKRGK